MSEQRSKKDEYQKALNAYALAVKEFHKGEFDKAVDLLKAVIEKYPADREITDRALAYLGIAQKRLKKETVSLRGFEDHFRYGVAKLNQGDIEAAMKLFEKSLEYKENEGRVYFMMADASCRLGKVDEGLDYLKKAIQKDKSFAVAAQNEPDFTALWEDKRFKLLTRLI